jgi:hypothetical protein
LRLIDTTIYSMLRDFGVYLTLNHRTSDEVNVLTGERVQSPLVRWRTKAAMLPTSLARERLGKSTADITGTEFIFSSREIDHEPTASDYIVLEDGRRFQIETVEDLSGSGWIVTARHLAGQGAEAIGENINNTIGIQGAANDSD